MDFYDYLTVPDEYNYKDIESLIPSPGGNRISEPNKCL